jgi:hypothetical protein
MSLCQIMPFFIFASAIVGGVIAWAVGARISSGVTLGMAAGVSPVFLLGLLVGLMQLWRPDCPRCLCGRRRYDYVETIKPDEVNLSSWKYHYRCLRCRRNFLQSGNAFEVMDENGALAPYMIHSEWGRWRRVGSQAAGG